MASAASATRCDSCDQTFDSLPLLQQHYRESSHHNYCAPCDRHFGSDHALWQHEQDSYNHFPCCLCSRVFDTEDQVVEHGQKEHNTRIVYHYDDYDDYYDYDDYDDEGYDTEDYDEDDVNCFGCGLAVESFSGMLFHLESGNCECRTTRDDLNRLALGCHTSNQFIVHGREEFLRQGQSYRRARQSHFNPRTQYWECPWCNFSGTSFHGLDMHLLSPVHDVKAFICPDQYCRQQFVNLSGLVAHVESDRCDEELWEGGETIGKLLDHLESRLLARR